MAQPSLQEITQFNSSVNIINTENNVSVPLRQNVIDLNFRFPILLERYSALVGTHETIRNEFQALKSGTTIQYSEVMKLNKDLLETNEKLANANAVLLQISQSGEERQEGAKVSPENLEALRDTQKLNDQLTKDTKNSAKSLSHLEELEKVNKKRLGKISVLVERVEGCIGNVCELEETLFRNLNKKCDEEEIANLKRQLKQKEVDVIEAQKKNEKLQEEQKNLEDSLAPDGSQDENLLQRRYDELQELHQHQLNLIQRLEDRISIQRSEISRLQQEPLQAENSELKKDLKGANDEIIKLEADIQQLKKTKINLNKNLRRAKTNYQKSKESNNTLRQEVVDLTNALFASNRPPRCYKRKKKQNLLQADKRIHKALSVPVADQLKKNSTQKLTAMEMHPDASLFEELQNVTKHNEILHRRIMELENNEKRLLEEKNSEEHQRQQAFEILTNELQAAKCRNLQYEKKVQDSITEIERLRNVNQKFLRKVQELELEKSRIEEEVHKLEEKPGKFMWASFSIADKFKTSKPQQEREEVLNKSIASDRKQFAEELSKTIEYTRCITEIAKAQQQRMSNWQTNDADAELQKSKQTIKELTVKLEVTKQIAESKINLMEIEMDRLTLKNENLRKQLNAEFAKLRKIQQSDLLVDGIKNSGEGIEEPQRPQQQKSNGEDPSLKISPKSKILINGSIKNENGINTNNGEGMLSGIPIKIEVGDIGARTSDNRDQRNEPLWKRLRLCEHSAHVTGIKKEM
ncbi:unnamed protein product [Orchesella dallaii]|uniref:Uncharacterized protein n=1 Tax=Orchesella dallaii TaxID=48710 RepID=A0ABP1RHV2_9HEXA